MSVLELLRGCSFFGLAFAFWTSFHFLISSREFVPFIQKRGYIEANQGQARPTDDGAPSTAWKNGVKTVSYSDRVCGCQL